MKTKLIIFSGIILLLFNSCDNYDQFKEELYKNEIYIISEGGNFKSILCDLNDPDSTHYVSFSYTGTTKIDRDVIIDTRKDTILLDKYNYNNFEFDSVKYIRSLNEKMFQFPSSSFVLKCESRDVYGLLPFYIKPESIVNLCPDSIYVIPIAVKSVSDYGVKKDKFNAMVRIYIKNKYAERTNTVYNMKGYRGEGTMSGNSIGTNKTIYPLSANSVRFFVGLENPPAKEAVAEDINRISAKITIREDKRLELDMYKPESDLLNVELLPQPDDQPDFPWINIYEETPAKFPGGKPGQRFLIYYRYRLKNIDKTWGDWIYMREILNRLQ